MTTWILTADASRADLFAAVDEAQEWALVEQLEHPESRQKDVELSPTEPGHSAKSKGSARRTAFDSKSRPHDVEKSHFAEELCKYLDSAAAQRQYEKLWIFAPPQFLGLLRKGMSSEVERRLAGTGDHDYHFASARQAKEFLQERISAASH